MTVFPFVIHSAGSGFADEAGTAAAVATRSANGKMKDRILMDIDVDDVWLMN